MGFESRVKYGILRINWVLNRKAETGSVKRIHGLFPSDPASKLVRSPSKPKDTLKRTSTLTSLVVYEAYKLIPK